MLPPARERQSSLPKLVSSVKVPVSRPNASEP